METKIDVFQINTAEPVLPGHNKAGSTRKL